MRTIVVLTDSLNRHNLEVYGEQRIKTPNITRFAQRSVVFDNHWLGSAPCMPARRDMFTGRLNFLWRTWGPIEPFDRTLQGELRKAGCFTHMITDHYHYFEVGGENYVNAHDTWDYIRGQEIDPWISRVEGEFMPAEWYGKMRRQSELNKTGYASEDEYPTPKTFQAACDWLDANATADDFLLWVEAFDPHEPFFAPDEYMRLYGDEYDGAPYSSSSYAEVSEPPEAVRHLRNRYAAVVTMMDRWFGRLLDKLEALNMFDDTLIVFTTDHGHLLGEHNFTGKCPIPQYNELSHLPLIVHLPQNRRAGERVDILTQNIDMMPTILDYHGIDAPEGLHGYSWYGHLERGEPYPRTAALFGWFGCAVNVTNGRTSYFRAPASEENQPLYAYSAMPVSLRKYWPESSHGELECGRFLPFTEMPVYRRPMRSKRWSCDRENLLFDNEDDYAQMHPLDDETLERTMIALMDEEMERIQAPHEQWVRLGMR